MKQVLLEAGRAVVTDVPPPQMGPGELLVRVAYSAISIGTERANVRSSGESVFEKARRKPQLALQTLRSMTRDGVGVTLERVRNKLRDPIASGYSCAGTVLAVGEAVEGFAVGQRVACAGAQAAWHADVVSVPRNLVVPVPDGVSLADASSVAIGAIALQGVRQAELTLGDVVVVTGLGVVGLLAVQLARAAGATVVAVDPVADRRDLALRVGAAAAVAPEDADRAVEAATGGLGADRVLIAAATPSNAPLEQAMRMTRKRGIVVVVGDVGLTLSRSPFYEKEVELRISCSYGPGRYDPTYEEQGLDYPPAYVRWTENRNMSAYLQCLATERVQWAALVEREYAVEDAPEAFARVAGADPPLALLLRYDAEDVALTRTMERHGTPAQGVARETVRLGIIGAGAFARAVHLPNLKRLGDKFVVTAIATRSGPTALAAARQAGAGAVATDYRELLERSDVDAVLVATRHDVHAEIAVAALEAGKGVLLEKPAAVSPEQLDLLLETAGRTGLPFMVGFNRRFAPATALVRERVAAAAGPPLVIYRVNADPGGSGDWSHGAEGGGRAVGEACHMVDLLHAIADAPLADVRARAAGGTGPRDANFSAQLAFENGAVGTLVYTTLGQRALAKERVEVFLGGEVVVIDDFREVQRYEAGRSRARRSETTKGLREEWEVFHALCTGSAPTLPIPLDVIRSVTEATFAIRDEVRR